MWLLLFPVAGLLGYLFYDKTHPKAAEPLATPPPPKGAGRVDGHGTGVLPESAKAAGLVDGHGTGLIPEPDALAAAAAAAKIAQQKAAEQAAAQAAAKVASQSNPAALGQAAGLAAETLKLQLIEALNTPEGDRTPEQLAIVNAAASLPVFSPDAKL